MSLHCFFIVARAPVLSDISQQLFGYGLEQ
jgi:hypothetical protein